MAPHPILRDCIGGKAVLSCARMHFIILDWYPLQMLAQGAWQICLAANGPNANMAKGFLADGCTALRSAFGLDALLLQNMPAGGPPHGPTLIWYELSVYPTT